MPLSFISPALVNTQAHNINAHSDQLADIRLVVKDLFDIAGLPTAAGNPDWLATHPVPTNTNSAVLALLNLGAHYIGKSVTDELAYSLNGQNLHYPELLNPISPDRILGGSSSGSAFAVATGLADIGLGTDTGGSIRVPASYNGLFGLRTSHGAIPTDNMVALAPSFDTVGWMSANIEDLITVANVLLAPEQEHKKDTIEYPVKLLALTTLINNAEHGEHIYEWLANISSAATVEFTKMNVYSMRIGDTFRVLQGYEIWQQHGDWITQNSPKFAADIDERFMWCKSITAQQKEDATKEQKLFVDYITEQFTTYDVIALPTTPGRAPLTETPAHELANYRNELMTFTAIAGLTGLPQVHLPLFSINGAPCGVSLIGKKGSDLRLLNIAVALLSKKHQKI
jgi:amidase